MKILLPVLKYDYGLPKRGPSLEFSLIYPALRAYAEVIPLWLEEHGYPENQLKLQKIILEVADEVDPDLIFFILMRNEVTIDTLEALGKRWRTCNWFADDQWRFDSFTRRLAPLFSHCITVDRFSLQKYLNAGLNNVLLSQWGANLSAHIDESSVPICDVSFIGGRNITRAWIVKELMKHGIKVACFGSGWSGGRLSEAEMASVVRSSKVSLNLSNSVRLSVSIQVFGLRNLGAALTGVLAFEKGAFTRLRLMAREFWELYTSTKKAEQIKARNFEIPAWGGFQISQFALGIDHYFIPGREIVLYSSIEELVSVIQYYLVMNEEREAIRKAGMQRVMEHTWDNVMGNLVRELEIRSR